MTDGPRTFTDSAGRKWVVDLNMWTMKRVRQLTGVELGKMTGKDGLEKLVALVTDDIEQFVNCLYVIVDCESKGVSDEEFGKSLKGDAIEHAANAFMGAYADFCRSQGREVLLKLLSKAEEYTNRVTTLAMTAVDSINVDELISKSSAASSPPSSGSTPTPDA